MQILVAAIIIVLFAVLRPRLSPDRPGKLQHVFELAYNFFHEQTEEQVGHHGNQYLAFFGTLFFFVLISNLIGVVPGFEAPTMASVSVPAGLAMAVFLLLQYRRHSGERSRQVPGAFRGTDASAGAIDDPDRVGQPPGAPAFTHHSPVGQYVCRRAGNFGVLKTYPGTGSGGFHGPARFCFFPAGNISSCCFPMMYVAGA